MGVVSQLPDLSAVLQLAGIAENGIGGVGGHLGRLSGAESGTPLHAVSTTLRDLQSRLNFDTSGLTEGLPAALTTIRNAVPTGAVDSIRGISGSFSAARSLLGDSPLAREALAAGSLSDAARAVLTGAVDQFRSRQLELAGRLIDVSALTAGRSGLQTLRDLRTDFATHQGQLLPFLSDHLIGVAPTVFEPAVAHVRSSLAVLNPLHDTTLEGAIGSARAALDGAARSVLEAVTSLNAADPAAYANLQTRLDALNQAIVQLRDALLPLYRAVAAAVNSHNWDAIFGQLETLLRGLPTISGPEPLSTLVSEMSELLSELVMRAQTVFSPEDLARRIDGLSRTIRDTFLNSPLGQVRAALERFLGDVRRVLEDIPLDEAQRILEGMLTRVRQEIEGLGLTTIGDRLDEALRDAEQFITDNIINSGLRDQVRAALHALVEQLQTLPLDDVCDAVTSLASSLESLITEFAEAIDGAVEQVSAFLAELEQLSFQPVSDAVIAEIDAIKTKLQAINPNALSDIEKLALQGALALLRSLDLESEIINGLKSAFALAGEQLRRLLDELAALLDDLRQRLQAYDPRVVIAGVTDVLASAAAALEGLNGRMLLRPFYEQIDAAVRELEQTSPGRILDPLQGPYQTAVGAVRALDPAEWLAPLNEVYAAIDRLIGFIDVTPLLDDLDRRRRELLGELRSALLDAIDGLNLPEPLSGFVATLRPFVEAMTDVLFTDPQDRLPAISTELRSQVRVSDLFGPLDRIFDELVAMIAGIPPDAMIAAVNALRDGVVLALDSLDPASIIGRLREGLASVGGLGPDVMLHVTASLPAARADFELRVGGAPGDVSAAVAATRLRFDALAQSLSPDGAGSVLIALRTEHAALETSLRRRVNSLAPGGVETAYSNVRRSLEGTIPAFLRQTRPLTREDIVTGLEALRPSRQAAAIDRLVNEFLQKLQPMLTAVEEPINTFFRSLQDVVRLIDPLSLRDAIAGIYDTIRSRVRVIDPVALAARIRADLLQPVLDTLDGLDPQRLKERLDAAYSRVVTALANAVRGILDDIATAINDELQVLRQRLAAFTEQLTTSLTGAVETIQRVIERVEALLFVELIERLRSVIRNLEESFGRELDRVRAAFDEMLDAIPLGGQGASESAAIG